MWNERFKGEDYLFGTAPAAFLTAQAGYLPQTGRALVLADGEGRNSVFLAERGLQVTAFDFAPNALEKARKLARSRGVTVDFHLADILRWDWDARAYDVVAGVFFQFLPPRDRDAVFAGIARALTPGGLLMLHGYAPRQVGYGTGGPSAEENMYTLPLLRAAFAGFDELYADDYDAELAEGTAHAGKSALIDWIAAKPR